MSASKSFAESVVVFEDARQRKRVVLVVVVVVVSLSTTKPKRFFVSGACDFDDQSREQKRLFFDKFRVLVLDTKS